jgi:hypothetical protein
MYAIRPPLDTVQPLPPKQQATALEMSVPWGYSSPTRNEYLLSSSDDEIPVRTRKADDAKPPASQQVANVERPPAPPPKKTPEPAKVERAVPAPAPAPPVIEEEEEEEEEIPLPTKPQPKPKLKAQRRVEFSDTSDEFLMPEPPGAAPASRRTVEEIVKEYQSEFSDDDEGGGLNTTLDITNSIERREEDSF